MAGIQGNIVFRPPTSRLEKGDIKEWKEAHVRIHNSVQVTYSGFCFKGIMKEGFSVGIVCRNAKVEAERSIRILLNNPCQRK